MKTTLLLCALAVNGFAAQPVLPRVTPETLAKLQQIDPMARLDNPAAGKAKVARPVDQSVIKQSTILHDGNHWTLVPTGAVVFLPNGLRERVVAKPMGSLIPWADFLANNRSWITTHEVTFEQAAGDAPIPAQHATFWAKQDKIVIAVHQNGPISVRLPDTTRNITRR